MGLFWEMAGRPRFHGVAERRPRGFGFTAASTADVLRASSAEIAFHQGKFEWRPAGMQFRRKGSSANIDALFEGAPGIRRCEVTHRAPDSGRFTTPAAPRPARRTAPERRPGCGPS